MSRPDKAAGKSSGGAPKDHIPATDHATRYRSRLTDPGNGVLTQSDLNLLSHVNCSYLSPGGEPPTLLALKKHAQSLAVLISKLSTKRTFVLISKKEDNDANPAPSTDLHHTTMLYDAFDWLHTVDKPYNTTDDLHHVPLWALTNQVNEESEEHGVIHHCPLQQVQVKRSVLDKKGGERFPYQTHGSLLEHANDCLEILDSEYSDTGGVISILPEPPTKEQSASSPLGSDYALQGARNTIIGQWILHHQHLVTRMHELEINYGNALDLLEADAVVPMELLSDAGTVARASGAPIAYPQDRFILSGLDGTMDEAIHKLLDEEEARQTGGPDTVHRAAGVIGNEMWRGEEGDGYERGLVHVDLISRYYRIKGARRSTIFIMPAAEILPRTKGTRVAEGRPTVVAIRQGDLPPWAEPKEGGLDLIDMSKAVVEKLSKDRETLIEKNKQLRTVVDVLKRDLENQRKLSELQQMRLSVLQEKEEKEEAMKRGKKEAQKEEKAAQKETQQVAGA